MRFQGAGWGVCASPTGGPQGQLQTAWCVTGMAISSRSSSCGRKTSRRPTVATPWRASSEDDAREPSLLSLRPSLDPETLVALGPIGRVQISSPVVLPPKSLIADSQQACRRAQQVGPVRGGRYSNARLVVPSVGTSRKDRFPRRLESAAGWLRKCPFRESLRGVDKIVVPGTVEEAAEWVCV